ncbi:MAG: ABC transporter substrate-binding protein [Alphaproteobacteria bacterium]|nr:ABC transporter substrate-binding protein [Alphaproteobacteria bacterium]
MTAVRIEDRNSCRAPSSWVVCGSTAWSPGWDTAVPLRSISTSWHRVRRGRIDCPGRGALTVACNQPMPDLHRARATTDDDSAARVVTIAIVRAYCREVRMVGRIGFAVVVVAALAGASGSAMAAEKTLRFGVPVLPPGQGHVHNGAGVVTAPIIQAFFDSFTYVDEKGAVVPGLAMVWQAQAKDNWVFKLRPNVRFQNGEPLTAQTVVSNIEFLASEPGQATAAARLVLGTLAGAKAVDDLAVEIRTKEPSPLLPRLVMDLRLFEPKAWNELGPQGFAKKPIGTGPFRVSEWGAERVQATAFREGWRAPKVDRLEIAVLAEPAARLQALLSDQIDVALDLAADDKERVERLGGRLNVAPYPAVVAMALRTTVDGPLKDVRVRQALNYGVDKETYVRTLLHGLTVVGSHPAARSVLGYQPDIKPYPYDPAMAKKLLAEAGYGNGVKLKAEVVVARTEYASIFQQVSASLAQAGIDLEIRPVTLPDLVKKVLGQAPWGDIVVRSSPYVAYPSIEAMRGINAVHSCKSQSYWTCDQEIEPVIQLANEEFDPGKRDQYVAQVMKRYRDQAWGLFLHEELQVDGLSKRIRNYKPVNVTINYADIDLAD